MDVAPAGYAGRLRTTLVACVTFTAGATDQTNFRDLRIARMRDIPYRIHTDLVESTEPPSGVGEPGVPPVGAALAFRLIFDRDAGAANGVLSSLGGNPITCPAGNCAFECIGGSTCNIDCDGGNCKLECNGGANCNQECDGGKCATECNGGANCNLDCDGGRCSLECAQGANCHQQCDGGNCS